MELTHTDFILRPITEADTDDILKWRNNDNVRKYFLKQDKLNKTEHLNWLRTKVASGRVLQFIILHKPGGQSIGTVYLHNIDTHNRKAEYGIFIGEELYTNKGYGSRIAECIIHYAFHHMKLHKLYLRVLDDNYRAISCYEKAGFQKEGLLKDEVIIDGKYRNIFLMGIINPDPAI